ncbi:MAG: NUDIX hydrolase [Nonlabens sp.]|nr:NUDIX hydrolase [Nonlabens sp.]
MSKILKEEQVFNDFFTVLKAQVTYKGVDSKKDITATRLCLERGDSVAVLLFEKDTDSFLFTKQYRYPSARREKPIMVELVAGSLTQGENPQECARREVKEELGYEVKTMQLITTYFPSPGGCSEQIHLFYSEVDTTAKIQKGGGVETEQESIELVKIPKSEIRDKLQSGFFNNSISIIGLQWYLLSQRI